MQKAAVLMAALAVVFDGFDNQLAGFAIPAMVHDWHVPRSAFSPVLALGLVGMSIGSALVGRMGDRFGRRNALSGSVVLFGLATSAVAFAGGIPTLAALRILAGAGIGGALPNAAAIAAEFTPFARRAFTVAATIVCVPIGGMLAGVTAAAILPSFGWRPLFGLGGVAPVAFGVALWFLLPESPRYLARHRHRWPELARLLARLGHPVPEHQSFEDSPGTSAERPALWRSFFGTAFCRDTICLWLAFLGTLASVYMAFSWLPSMLAAEGLGLAASSTGLAVYNLGGVVGALFFGSLIARFGSRGPMLAAAFGAVASGLAIGAIPASAHGDSFAIMAGFCLNGLFVNAVQTTAFALAAHIYPTEVRATGVAVALAIGRLGSILSAYAGASLVASGRPAFAGFLAIAMAGALVGLALVKNHIPPAGARRG